jgi:hypothetical protein
MNPLHLVLQPGELERNFFICVKSPRGIVHHFEHTGDVFFDGAQVLIRSSSSLSLLVRFVVFLVATPKIRFMHV